MVSGFLATKSANLFKPLYDRVLIVVDEQDQKKGNVLLPDSKEKPCTGTIVAVGNGARNENGTVVPLCVKCGDKVLFNKWAGTEIKLEGVDYLVLKESDILGIIV